MSLAFFDLAFLYIKKINELYPTMGEGIWLRGLYLDGIGEEGDALMCFSKARELGYHGDTAE